MKLRKRILGLLLASSILVWETPHIVLAEPLNDSQNEEVSIQNNVDNEGEETQAMMGYIASPEDENAPVVDEQSIDNDILKEVNTPVKYNPLETSYGYQLPSIRNQNPYGTCWAFSTAAITEMSYLLKTGNPVDVSELQIAYYTYHGSTDPLGGTNGDSVDYVGTGETYLDFGGNLSYSTQALMNWRGAVDEATVPYSEAAQTLSNGLPSEYEYNSDRLHVQDVYKINIKGNPNEVKKAIMNYGAVGASYYHDASYYNAANNSYYCTESGSNHAIAIVGWDDDFPASNFNTAPSENGAWLIRNSWGDDAMSMSGYFWMSYEDVSLNNTVYAVVAEDASNYDHNYQYDGGITAGYVYLNAQQSVANVFTIKGEQEMLKAVSMVIPANSQVNYTIKIYKNLTDSTNPESGILVSSATTSGTTEFAGSYTIPLNNGVILKKGENFSVVVNLSKEGETVGVGTEGTQNIWNSVNVIVSAEAGQSFCKTGTSWVDYGANCNENLRIKAYTSDIAVESYNVTLNANGGTVTPNEISVYNGDVYGTLPVPTRKGYGFIGWYTEASGGIKITEDTQVELSNDQTLYAHWVKASAVTLNANGGSVTPSTISVIKGEKYGTLPIPVKNGYEFTGWYTQAEGGTEVTEDTIVSVSGNHTLYAQWIGKQYKVTLNANGGWIDGSNSLQVRNGDKYGTLPISNYEGMSFVGWYTKPEGGTKITENTIVNLSKEQTLYAHYSGWKKSSTGDIRLYDNNGNMVTNQFAFDGSYTYYLQADGSPMKDRLTYHPDGEHIIYLDSNGHEVFNNFQYCPSVGYTCYFDSQGYLYKDQITFVGDKVYYLNANGAMENSGWFRFANGMDYGFANWDGTLNTSGFSYDPWGRLVFYHWNGMVARGLITDGAYYYSMDTTDGHYLGSFPVN